MSNEQFVVVIGWFVLAGLQVLIIVKQANLEKKIEGYKISTNRFIKHLQEFIDWVDEGSRVYTMKTNAIALRNYQQTQLLSKNKTEKVIADLQRDEIEWKLNVMKYGLRTKRIWDVKIGKGRKEGELLFPHYEKFLEIFDTITNIDFEQATKGLANSELYKKAEYQRVIFVNSYIRVVEITEEYIQIIIKREEEK